MGSDPNEQLKLYQNKIRKLEALRRIDAMIASNLELSLTMNLLLGEATDLLQADAARLMLRNNVDGCLEYSSGIGFRSPNLAYIRLRPEEGYSGKVAGERRLISVSSIPVSGSLNLPNADPAASAGPQRDLLIAEGFQAYHGVPVMFKDVVRGVLEIYSRSPRELGADDVELLEALATQAAIAIDNAEMLRDLHRTNEELLQAYEVTLEGWVKALDLRDRETEGHTLRVTALAMELGRQIGIQGEALENLRRGALLHDIGKMGIPDDILLKPGPLTDDEWVLMRQHPVFAYEMLYPIAYLRPSLDIPYCHHELWDGSGYPRGLSGEDIPLAARIFTVVDMWDALTSRRPYHEAWPPEKALAYIRHQAGVRLDPQIVEKFMGLRAILV